MEYEARQRELQGENFLQGQIIHHNHQLGVLLNDIRRAELPPFQHPKLEEGNHTEFLVPDDITFPEFLNYYLTTSVESAGILLSDKCELELRGESADYIEKAVPDLQHEAIWYVSDWMSNPLHFGKMSPEQERSFGRIAEVIVGFNWEKHPSELTRLYTVTSRLGEIYMYFSTGERKGNFDTLVMSINDFPEEELQKKF